MCEFIWDWDGKGVAAHIVNKSGEFSALSGPEVAKKQEQPSCGYYPPPTPVSSIRSGLASLADTLFRLIPLTLPFSIVYSPFPLNKIMNSISF